MIYTLLDNNGLTTIEMDVIIPLKTFFVNEYGLFKVTQHKKESIICERFFNSQFYDFYNELNYNFDIKLNKNGFITIDIFNNAFNYEKYLLDENWENQEIFKILNKYNSLKNDIYFLWKDFETVKIVFDHY